MHFDYNAFNNSNLQAMSRDMKLNYYQQTAGVCKKKIELLLSKYVTSNS
jgi:hypothetical protein